ncbi:MAG: hypothetical protein N3A66_06005 [Planctomycetota bacterium]|nr:hypothetical protein [Planctomycetota bacterium]
MKESAKRQAADPEAVAVRLAQFRAFKFARSIADLMCGEVVENAKLRDPRAPYAMAEEMAADGMVLRAGIGFVAIARRYPRRTEPVAAENSKCHKRQQDPGVAHAIAPLCRRRQQILFGNQKEPP